MTIEPRMHVFTFVCLKQNEVSTAVDVQVLPTEAYRAHARSLLAEHASAEAVEVWRDNEAIDRIERGEGRRG